MDHLKSDLCEMKSLDGSQVVLTNTALASVAW